MFQLSIQTYTVTINNHDLREQFKNIAYKDLKTMLPAGNKLEALYKKSKDENQFDESLSRSVV